MGKRAVGLVLEEVEHPHPRSGGLYAPDWRYKEEGISSEKLTAYAQVVEQIIERVLPSWDYTSDPDAINPWQGHRDGAIRAIAQLETQELLNEKLSTPAPKLNAEDLHPWVWDGARTYWESGHFRDAVNGASRSINAHTQAKVQRRDASEYQLIRECFSLDPPAPNKPRLRLMEPDGSDTFKALHSGLARLAEGLFSALRNPSSHEVLEEIEEHIALEQLAAFSVLARSLDDATVSTA